MQMDLDHDENTQNRIQSITIKHTIQMNLIIFVICIIYTIHIIHIIQILIMYLIQEELINYQIKFMVKVLSYLQEKIKSI